MLKYACCIFLAAVVTSQLVDPPPVVSELDITKYIGRWYQTHGSQFVIQTEIRNGTCTTADYDFYNETAISVLNTNRVGAPDGPIDNITGLALTTDEPGKLLVYFPEIGYGDYWVLQLGPPTFGEEGLYQYSLVSVPNKSRLYILARDVDDFKANYEEDVLIFLDELGFNEPINEPIELYHGDDCLYIDTDYTTLDIDV